jgi:hypothetical protein
MLTARICRLTAGSLLDVLVTALITLGIVPTGRPCGGGVIGSGSLALPFEAAPGWGEIGTT